MRALFLKKNFFVCVCVQPILESGVIELLCSLTQSDSPALRVNGIWALMVRICLYNSIIYVSSNNQRPKFVKSLLSWTINV